MPRILPFLVVPGLVLLARHDASALPSSKARALITAARALLGVPYELGGRMRAPGEGIDCQGVVFFAAERVARCGWRSFSTRPTQSVADEELGGRVPGLDPVATRALDTTALAPGDMLRLVGFANNPREPAIGVLDGRPVWVWHGGLYSGDGNWIVGDHFAGEVVETPLMPYLEEHSDSYAGVFVSRMKDGPQPRRCRRHPPMQRP